MPEYQIIVGKEGALTQTLYDQATGVVIELEYRLPTNRERNEYQKASIKSKRAGKTSVSASKAALKLAPPLIMGFRFTDKDTDTHIKIMIGGKVQTLSSTPGDPGYVENWRPTLKKAIPHVIESFGLGLFNSVAKDDGGIEFEPGYDEDEDAEPVTAADDEPEAQEGEADPN